MTISAHNSRRAPRGATRQHEGRTGARNDWYKELHPEMHKAIPSSKPVKPPPQPRPQPRPVAKTPLQKQSSERRPRVSAKAIKAYLQQGDATARQVAQALGLSYEAVYMCLWRGIDGIDQKGMYLPEKGAPSQLWGVVVHGT